jgi:hypothetical protein
MYYLEPIFNILSGLLTLRIIVIYISLSWWWLKYSRNVDKYKNVIDLWIYISSLYILRPASIWQLTVCLLSQSTLIGSRLADWKRGWMNKTHGSVQAPWFRAGSLDNFMRKLGRHFRFRSFPVLVVSGFGLFGFRSSQRPTIQSWKTIFAFYPHVPLFLNIL